MSLKRKQEKTKNLLDEPVHQIGLNRLKQFAARAAQIYNLLNQISLSDAWQSLRLEMSQNTGVWSCDAGFCQLIQCSSSSKSHWIEEKV